ncbi:nitroreductase family deazaflavin-dependent oxidoreductase [Mycobacterium sp. DBP42]|uniref:nitroreductase family deazaflavin-dependent oxidoreductase n=1 Tax=Mycobacterium sp. DBP42 TaxID=2545267 RepID=UPI00110CCE41|nr:nitroreductase family deazaflavin-dependent oxidoreductase [Mycobacterium sp. DBP42]
MTVPDLPDTSFNPEVIAEFRANGGKVGGPWHGANLVLLHTTGAKTGKDRVTPLGRFDIVGKIVVVGSYAGADINPAWVHNLRAHPRARVEIGDQAFAVEARELAGPEREAAWRHITTVMPPFAQYQEHTSRILPLFELRKI